MLCFATTKNVRAPTIRLHFRSHKHKKLNPGTVKPICETMLQFVKPKKRMFPPIPPKNPTKSSANHHNSYCTTATTPNITYMKSTELIYLTPSHTPVRQSPPCSRLQPPALLAVLRRVDYAAAGVQRAPLRHVPAVRRSDRGAAQLRQHDGRLHGHARRPDAARQVLPAHAGDRAVCQQPAGGRGAVRISSREPGAETDGEEKRAKCNFVAKRIVLDLRQRRAIGQTSWRH